MVLKFYFFPFSIATPRCGSIQWISCMKWSWFKAWTSGAIIHMLEIAMCNLHIMNLNLERAILMIATLSNSVEMRERERVNKQKTIKRLKIGIELKTKQSNLDKSLAKLKVIDKKVLFFPFCFFHLFDVKNFSLKMGKLKMLCQQKLRSISLRWHIIRFKQWRK